MGPTTDVVVTRCPRLRWAPLAALRHPNNVVLYSVEDHGDVRVLAMELVEGQSLDQCIPLEGMPLGRAQRAEGQPV